VTLGPWWSLPASEISRRLATTVNGLSAEEAARRLDHYGPNQLRDQRAPSRARVLWTQIRSPLVLLLVFAAAVSALSGVWVDAVIVGAIVLLSAAVGYAREYRAQEAAAALRARVEANDLFVNEAVLTGESFPREKRPGVSTATSALRVRDNCVFLGTNVRSGAARCLVVATGVASNVWPARSCSTTSSRTCRRSAWRTPAWIPSSWTDRGGGTCASSAGS
jgi:Mg2+-importing ATPase